MNTALTGDERRIVAIYHCGGDGHGHVVGRDGVARIKPYDEHGGLGWEPWLEIYFERETGPRLRVPARYFEVHYEQAVLTPEEPAP